MKTTFLTLASAFLFGLSGLAQDVHFSQFAYSPLNLSPAMAGANHDAQIIVNYRDQWRAVTTPYTTFGASADFRLNSKSRDGYFVSGVNFYRDKAGDSQMGTTQADLILGYQLFVSNESSLGLAVNGGFVQRSMETANLEWGSQFDGTSYNSDLPSGEHAGRRSSMFGDLGVGMVYSYKSKTRFVTVQDPLTVNVGASFDHLLKPKYDFTHEADPLYRKFTLFGQAVINSPNSKLGIEPAFMYVRQGPTQEVMLGSYISYTVHGASHVTTFVNNSRVALGAYYRTGDALMIGARYDIANFSAGIAYDLNLSDLTVVSKGQGGFEISLKYVSPNPFGKSKGHTMFR